ncbi:MAG: hypothetical protein IJE40_04225, partial [Clostridia bacterium]|nr:hypothetical protein [Clostridia bacterium]
MKEFIVSLLSVILGASLLSIAIVNEKLKNNIKVIISLIIAVSALSRLPSFDFNSIINAMSLSEMDGYIYDTEEFSVENCLNEAIEQNIRDHFGIDIVIAETDVSVSETYVEILSLNVEVKTDIKLVNIHDYLKDHLKISGKISVTRIKDEGIK